MTPEPVAGPVDQVSVHATSATSIDDNDTIVWIIVKDIIPLADFRESFDHPQMRGFIWIICYATDSDVRSTAFLVCVSSGSGPATRSAPGHDRLNHACHEDRSSDIGSFSQRPTGFHYFA